MDDDRPAAGELADTLKDLRHRAGLSSPRAAALLHRSQSWVAHRENGRVVPTADEVDLLAGLYDAPAKARRRLHALVNDLRGDPTPSARVVMRRGARQMQQRIGRIEASSRRIATFSPTVMPGLLQTEQYMRLVFASGNDLVHDQQVAAVLERLARTRLLHESSREFAFVLTEGALRWQLGGPTGMAAQLDHVVELSRLPTVRVGVIPWTTAVDLAPMHAFDVLDRRAAVVGIETVTAFLTNAHDVAAYMKLFADLEAAASFGDDAREILAACADAYRALST